jgi:HK97 family phage major capsid protein
MNTKELHAKRETYLGTARSILDRAQSENRDLSDSEKRDYDGLFQKINGLKGTIDRGAQLNELLADMDRPVQSPGAGLIPASEDGMIYGGNRSARSGEVRIYKPNEAIAEQRYVGPGIGAYVRGMVTGRWEPELRALAEGTPSAGGYVVPTPLALQVIDLLRNQAQVHRAGAVSVTMNSATLKMARLASDVTAAWKSENSPLTYSDNSFQQILFTANTLIAGAKISMEMIEDSENIDAVVGNSIARALALGLDYAALYGSGTAPAPTGIKNQTGVTLTNLGSTAGYTLVDWSKLSQGISTLMQANVEGPFGAIYSARTAGELDNLRDSLGQPMRPAPNVEKMAKFVSNQVPNNIVVGTATTTSDIFIGQWDQCMIGYRNSMMLEISREAADSTGSAFSNLQVWIRAYLRADVQLAHPQAFNVLEGVL